MNTTAKNLKKLALSITVAAATAATIVLAPSASAVSQGSSGRPSPEAVLRAQGSIPPSALVSCQHLYGSQWICRVSWAAGDKDYHCDTAAKVCRPV